MRGPAARTARYSAGHRVPAREFRFRSHAEKQGGRQPALCAVRIAEHRAGGPIESDAHSRDDPRIKAWPCAARSRAVQRVLRKRQHATRRRKPHCPQARARRDHRVLVLRGRRPAELIAEGNWAMTDMGFDHLSCLPSSQCKPSAAEELIDLGESDTANTVLQTQLTSVRLKIDRRQDLELLLFSILPEGWLFEGIGKKP